MKNSTTYFNIKTSYGVETVDELSSEEFASPKDYREERKRLVKEYRLAGMAVYTSSRCTKDWAAR